MWRLFGGFNHAEEVPIALAKVFRHVAKGYIVRLVVLVVWRPCIIVVVAEARPIGDSDLKNLGLEGRYFLSELVR
jgi:hypothetical protein